MSTITIPFWIFALSLGVPCAGMLFLMGFLLRKIRNPKKETLAKMCIQNAEDQQGFRPTFHSDLLRMQVDTIFNGLNAIIETERLKINALLSPNNPNLFETKTAPVEAPEENTPLKTQEASKTVEPTLEQQMVNVVSSGEDIDELATELGLSQTEIDLAMKMRSSRASNRQGRKLEAVA